MEESGTKNLVTRFKRKRNKDYSELEQLFEVQKWIKGLSQKEHNRRKYLSVLDDFYSFTGKNPKELIDEEELDRKKDRRTQMEPAKTHITEFYAHCKDKMRISPNSAKWKAFSVIAGFYHRNGFPIYFGDNETPATGPPIREKVFKVNGKMEQDLKKVLKLLLHNLKNLRDKAILTMMTCSGMDMADLFKLQYKDVKNWLDQEDFVTFEYVREKVKNKVQIPAVTVFTAESLDYLKAYLTQEYPQPIADTDYVFISLKNYKHQKKQMTENRFTTEIDKICASLGISNVSPKSLRRFCYTKLEDSGIPKLYKDLWLGHSSKISDAYDLWSKYPEKLRELYAPAIPYVTIGNGNIKLNQEIEQFKEKLKEKDNQIAAINEQLTKIITENQNQKNIYKVLFELQSIQASLKDHPLIYRENSNHSDVDMMIQSESALKIQGLLEKLRKLIE